MKTIDDLLASAARMEALGWHHEADMFRMLADSARRDA